MRGVLYSGSPDLGIKEKLRTLRKIRVAYDARVKEIYRIQGQIASGRSRESTVSFEDASRQINKIMDENPPWLEFEKLLGPEGGRSSKSDLSLHRSIHNALADRINKSSFIDPGMKESRNDLAYLTRIASAHSMRDNASRGKYYLLAKHSPWAIESMLNGTYIDLDKDLSTTVVWDGIPCTLYAEKRHQGRSGFGVVYNPENLKFKYGEFYAYATFGVSPVDRVVKMGSVTGTYDLKGNPIDVKKNLSKYPLKQGIIREIIDKEKGTITKVFITDYSRWDSQRKTWYDGDDPDKLLEIFSRNIWWRYNRPKLLQSKKQFDSKSKYKWYERELEEKGSQRYGGKGSAQYNEGLITPKENCELKDLPKSIFIDVSYYQSIDVGAVRKISELFENYPHLTLCVYNSRNKPYIMEEYSNKEAKTIFHGEFLGNSRSVYKCTNSLVQIRRNSIAEKLKKASLVQEKLLLEDGRMALVVKNEADGFWGYGRHQYDIYISSQGVDHEIDHKIFIDKEDNAIFKPSGDRSIKVIFRTLTITREGNALRNLIWQIGESAEKAAARSLLESSVQERSSLPEGYGAAAAADPPPSSHDEAIGGLEYGQVTAAGFSDYPSFTSTIRYLGPDGSRSITNDLEWFDKSGNEIVLADGRKVLLNVRSSWNSQGKLEYSYILKITSSDDPEIEYKFNLNDEKGEYYSKDGVDIRFMPQIIGSIANDIEISKGLATGGVAESLVSEPMADYQEVFPTDGFVSETLDVGACHPTAGMVEIDGVGASSNQVNLQEAIDHTREVIREALFKDAKKDQEWREKKKQNSVNEPGNPFGPERRFTKEGSSSAGRGGETVQPPARRRRQLPPLPTTVRPSGSGLTSNRGGKSEGWFPPTTHSQ